MKTAEEIREEARRARASRPIGLIGNEAYIRALAWVLGEDPGSFGEPRPDHVSPTRTIDR